MVISILERRTEIGLRRALGAARIHIEWQFLTESPVMYTLGGSTRVLIGGGVTTAMTYSCGWAVSISTSPIIG
jgi:putative ABC transport system permease protein